MKIQLPNFVIADWYKDALVSINEQVLQQSETPEGVTTKAEEPSLYLGNNLQHICIVLHHTTQTFTDEESLQLLSNLLAALNYNLEDAAIINHYRTPVDYTAIGRELQPRVCLLFGISTQMLQLPFIIPDYQLQRYEDCTFIQACALDVMKANDEKAKTEKRKLWTCLKSVFNK